jgi:hypothetical protein
MRAPFLAIGAIAIGVTLGVAACGGGTFVCSSSSAVVGGDAGGSRDGASDGMATMDASGTVAQSGNGDAASTPGDDGGGTKAGLRLANWSSDSPAVDFCLAPHGSTAFEGPMVAQLDSDVATGATCDAGGPGVPFPDVSAYLLVMPATYDVRLVVAGAPDCSVKLTDDTTDLPPFGAGTLTTIGLAGEADPVGGAPGLQALAFQDTGVGGAGVAVRFINAAANSPPSVELGVVLTGGYVSPIFTNVQFGQAGTVNGETVDAATPASETYFNVPIGEELEVSSSPGTGSISAKIESVAMAPGAVVTLVVAGPVSGATPTEVVECIDNAGTACALGTCQIVAP